MFRRPMILVAMLSLSVVASGDGAEKVKKVLYLGIDGCRFDAIEKAETPQLDALMKNGVYTGRCLILGDRYRKNDTVSGPGWSSIYTGVWADKHGVQNNTFKGSNYKDYPHFFQRIKEADPAARCTSFVTWKPIHDHIVSSADVSEALEPGKNYEAYDAEMVEKAIKELSEQDSKVVAYYIAQVDETGHKHGFHPTVPQYVAAVEKADTLVGKVLAAVQARKTYAHEDWLVIVTADHGGKGTNHGNGHTVPEIYNSFLIVSGDAAERGEFKDQTYIVDAVPTALTHLGVEIKEEWKLDGRAVGLKSKK